MHLRLRSVCALVALLACSTATAQESYRRPPDQIVKMLEAPTLPSPSIDPHRRWMLLVEQDNLPPIRDVPDEVETLKLDQIEVKSYVGGLVKSFERKAA